MDTLENIVAERVTVYKTRDYDRFILDETNRVLDVKRIVKMADYMRADNWLQYYPIVVTPDFVIRDGQHRHSAARLAGVELFYIVAENINTIDVASTNALTKAWVNWDYLKFWTMQGNKNYAKLGEFVEFYPLISLASGMFVCSNSVPHGMFTTFREGLWVFGDEDKAREAGEIMNLIGLYMRVGMNQTYPRSVRVIVRHERYDGDRFRSQLAKAASWLRPAATQAEALHILQDVFNYNMKKDRVSFVKV